MTRRTNRQYDYNVNNRILFYFTPAPNSLNFSLFSYHILKNDIQSFKADSKNTDYLKDLLLIGGNMKKTALLFFCAVLAGHLYAFDTEPSLAVKNGTREYTKTTYTISEKFGDYYRSPAAKFVHVFDANGREIESTELTNKDTVVDKVIYEYDANGRLTTTTCVNADGKINWKVVAVYDANGNKTEESQLTADDVLTSKSIWKYTGKQAEEAYYDADGALLNKTITKYDDKNREIEVAVYGANGNLEEKRVLAYNDADKLAEITFFNAADVPFKKIIYRFDAKYAVTEEQTYNAANKLAVRMIYKYDDNGNLFRTTTYNIADKFGTTVNELVDIKEYAYGNTASAASSPRSPTHGAYSVDAK